MVGTDESIELSRPHTSTYFTVLLYFLSSISLFNVRYFWRETLSYRGRGGGLVVRALAIYLYQ